VHTTKSTLFTVSKDEWDTHLGHDFFTLTNSVILLRKRGFHFGIALLDVEQCDDKQRFS